MTRSRALLALAAACFVLHFATNGQYGFHRDELAVIDDAKHLAWGYVAYPPLTPFLARVAMLLGSTPIAVRSVAALSQALVTLLTGLIAAELGGGTKSQVIAALAAIVSPVAMSAGHLFEYVTFDFLWSVLLIYCLLRLLNSGNPRWWIAAGVAAGLGLMTRYTIAWLLGGLLAGLLLTPARRFLMNGWFAAGLAVAAAIALPNLLWQVRHDFISLDFLRSIHARDVRIGRTDGFLWKQFLVPAHPFTIPLWIAGLVFLFRSKYRALAWTFIATLALFAVARARDYYSAPLYPMLLAAGAVTAASWRPWTSRVLYAGLAIALVLDVALLLPIAPPGSAWFDAALKVNGDLREEIGWPELVESVARIRASLPPDTGILTGNYGEAGAIDLYGGPYGLPPALGRVNSYWLRGYGDHPPQTLIVVGFTADFLNAHFSSCEPKGTISNRLGVANEETQDHRDLWVCRGLREPWPEFWKRIRAWG